MPDAPDTDGADQPRITTPTPSARVALEVSLLASEAPAAVPAGLVANGRVVLVVTADADLGGYVVGCFADRRDLVALPAGGAGGAPPHRLMTAALLVLGEREAPLADLAPAVPAIVLADAVPAGCASAGWPDAAPRRALPAPFQARSLLELADRLLARGPA